MDINLIKKRLGELSNKNKKSANLWKPKPGKHTVRIVPYKGNPSSPFIELLFHYDLNGKTYLSPASFDRPDPVLEFANTLKSSGDADEYKLGQKIAPKTRIYCPVIVRGEESQGVRFWAFGTQVYTALMNIVADEDYGDIDNIKTGNDITVEYIDAKTAGKQFPETKILPKPKKTPVGDASVIDAIKKSVLITELFEEPTYDDLKKALEAQLNPAGEESSGEESSDSASDEDEPAEEKPKSKPKGGELKKPSNDVEGDFDALFNA